MKKIQEQEVSRCLLKVFKVLAQNKTLKKYSQKDKVVIRTTGNRELQRISSKGIITPIGIVPKSLFSKPSPLKDAFIDLHLLSAFIKNLSSIDAIIRLNHIGFGYKVDSQNKERKRIKKEASNNNWHLYEIESNDDGLWLFIGDTTNWQDPLVEFAPVAKTEDHYVNYWLPHVQIDIDTNLSESKLERIIHNSFKGDRTAIRSVIIDGIIYVMRIWLGIIDGVNIYLDLATKSRNTEFTRKNVMKKLI